MTTATRQRRTRITREDIEAARQQLAKPQRQSAPKTEERQPRPKKDTWYGLVHCDSYGHCWIADFIDGEAKSIYLGKTDEFIPYLKSKRIDGENVLRVLQANRELRSEKESHSCHLATENERGYITDHPHKPVVATFRDDPRFLTLLEGLISQGKGIRVIHSELKSKGYEVPERTLGRWIKRHRDKSPKLADPVAT